MPGHAAGKDVHFRVLEAKSAPNVEGIIVRSEFTEHGTCSRETVKMSKYIKVFFFGLAQAVLWLFFQTSL